MSLCFLKEDELEKLRICFLNNFSLGQLEIAFSYLSLIKTLSPRQYSSLLSCIFKRQGLQDM